MNLTWNNNGYYQGPATTGALSLLAQVGTSAGSGEYLAANFDPGSTGNPLNLRTYTSTLSVTGTNAEPPQRLTVKRKTYLSLIFFENFTAPFPEKE
jgi:hypothetical protein